MQELFEKENSEEFSDTSKNVKSKKKTDKPDKKDFPEPKSFEEAMNNLEELVRNLESGDLQIEDSVEVYRKARFLASWCYRKLTSIEGELMKLGLDNDGKFTIEELPEIE